LRTTRQIAAKFVVGRFVRIQFDSGRDVLRAARCRRLFIPICGWDLATVTAEGSATMAVGKEDDPSQADEDE
jgi:hypothetical protein